MPVRRLTADCIWNSFQSSGKRHLILTGGRGSGKTTLLSGVSRLLQPSSPVPGITTWAEPGKAVYLRDNETGKTVLAGKFDPALPGPQNRMRPVEEGFRALGVAVLRRCMEGNGEWALIDEIGYLESGCGEYCAAIRALMGKKRLAAAVRRQGLPFLEELCRHPDVFLVDLDRPFGQLGCVIMASGLGRRFGGNKLLADFGGEPLIQRALDATEGIFARRAVVTRHREVEKLCRRQEIPAVFHDLSYRSDTVRLGLEEMGGEMAGCLFCPADQPLLRWETVASLALCAADGPKWIWRAAWGDREGAPVLFPSWAFGELKSLPEGGGGKLLIGKYSDRVRRVWIRDEWELEDVDRPEDLAILRKRWEKARMV